MFFVHLSNRRKVWTVPASDFKIDQTHTSFVAPNHDGVYEVFNLYYSVPSKGWMLKGYRTKWTKVEIH